MVNVGSVFEILQNLGAADMTGSMGSALLMLTAGSAQGTAAQEADPLLIEETEAEEEEPAVHKREQSLSSFFGGIDHQGGAKEGAKEGGSSKPKAAAAKNKPKATLTSERKSYNAGSAQGAITSGQDADPAGGGNRAMRLNGHAQRMRDKILPEINQKGSCL